MGQEAIVDEYWKSNLSVDSHSESPVGEEGAFPGAFSSFAYLPVLFLVAVCVAFLMWSWLFGNRGEDAAKKSQQPDPEEVRAKRLRLLDPHHGGTAPQPTQDREATDQPAQPHASRQAPQPTQSGLSAQEIRQRRLDSLESRSKQAAAQQQEATPAPAKEQPSSAASAARPKATPKARPPSHEEVRDRRLAALEQDRADTKREQDTSQQQQQQQPSRELRSSSTASTDEADRAREEDAMVQKVMYRTLGIAATSGGEMRKLDQGAIDEMKTHLSSKSLTNQLLSWVKILRAVERELNQVRGVSARLKVKLREWKELLLGTAAEVITRAASIQEASDVLLDCLRSGEIDTVTFSALISRLPAGEPPTMLTGSSPDDIAINRSWVLAVILQTLSEKFVTYTSDQSKQRLELGPTSDPVWGLPGECGNYHQFQRVFRIAGPHAASSFISDIKTVPRQGRPVRDYQYGSILGALFATSTIDAIPQVAHRLDEFLSAILHDIGRIGAEHREEWLMARVPTLRPLIAAVHDQSMAARRYLDPHSPRLRDDMQFVSNRLAEMADLNHSTFLRPMWHSSAPASPSPQFGSPQAMLLDWLQGILAASQYASEFAVSDRWRRESTPVPRDVLAVTMPATTGCLLNVQWSFMRLVQDEVNRGQTGVAGLVSKVDPLYTIIHNNRLGWYASGDVKRLSDTIRHPTGNERVTRLRLDRISTQAAQTLLTLTDERLRRTHADAPPPAPITELFWLTAKTFSLAFIPAMRQQGHIASVSSLLQSVAGGRGRHASATAGERVDVERSCVEPLKSLNLAYSAVLRDTVFLSETARWLNVAMAFIVQQAYRAHFVPSLHYYIHQQTTEGSSSEAPTSPTLSPTSPRPHPSSPPDPFRLLRSPDTPIPPCPPKYDSLLKWLMDEEQADLATLDEDKLSEGVVAVECLDNGEESRGPVELMLLPEWLVMDTLVGVDFVFHSHTAADRSVLDPQLVIAFVLLIVGAPSYFRRVDVLKKAFGLLESMLFSSDPHWTRQLGDSVLANAHLIPAIITYFTFQQREGIIWENVWVGNVEAKSDGARLFVRIVKEIKIFRDVVTRSFDAMPMKMAAFVRSICQDAISYVEEGLDAIAELKRLQDGGVNPQQAIQQLSPEHRNGLYQLPTGVKLLETLHFVVRQYGRHVSVLMTESVALFDEVVRVLNMIITRLVGPQALNLKCSHPERYGLNIREMLGWVGQMYADLFSHGQFDAGAAATSTHKTPMSADKFLERVQMDDRNFRIDTFHKARNILYRESLLDRATWNKFASMVARIGATLRETKERASEEMRLTEMAPPEFIDSLTGEIMKEPRRLPTGTVVDYTTLDKITRPDGKAEDPYKKGGSMLFDAKNDVEEVPDLKEKIHAFLADPEGYIAAHPTTQDDTDHSQHEDGSFTVKVQMVGSGSTMEIQLTVDTTLGDFAQAFANKLGESEGGVAPSTDLLRFLMTGHELPHKTQPGVTVGEKGVRAGMVIQMTRRPANVG